VAASVKRYRAQLNNPLIFEQITENEQIFEI
jgi:hypothetical protein